MARILKAGLIQMANKLDTNAPCEKHRDAMIEAHIPYIRKAGEQGVKMTEQEKPDLILMDLGMPVMDGWEATRRIKADDELKHIPIIAVTSHAMAGDEVEARKAGCDDYLPKPIDEDNLDLVLQLIERTLIG